MAPNSSDDPELAKLVALGEHPTVQRYIKYIQATAGYSLPSSLDRLFQDYREHCHSDPIPIVNQDWGPESPNWRWQKRHHEAVFGSAQAAATAVFYHRDNLLQIEQQLLSFPELKQLIEAMGSVGMGGGNTQKLDFEYHGFVFAYRRTLDYLTQAATALLRNDLKSFRDIPKLVKSYPTNDLVKTLVTIHGKYAHQLGTFLSDGAAKSVRDRLAHYNHVAAGALNVNASGVFIAGGGENLERDRQLGVVLNAYVCTLGEVISEMLSGMMQAIPKP